MTNDKKQKYIDSYNAIELLHDSEYMDNSMYRQILRNLTFTIVNELALELQQARDAKSGRE